MVIHISPGLYPLFEVIFFGFYLFIVSTTAFLVLAGPMMEYHVRISNAKEAFVAIGLFCLWFTILYAGWKGVKTSILWEKVIYQDEEVSPTDWDILEIEIDESANRD